MTDDDSPPALEGDGGYEREATPEERKKLQRQFKNVYEAALGPTFDLTVSGLVGSSTLPKGVIDYAKISGFSLSESALKNVSVASVAASQGSNVLGQFKALTDRQDAWLKELVLGPFGVSQAQLDLQSQLNLVGSHLTKNVDFGFSHELARMAQNYAAQQTGWLEGIAPAWPGIDSVFYPSNLRGIEQLDFYDIEQVAMLEGIALYEVPRPEIAEKLLKAPSSAARREILGRK